MQHTVPQCWFFSYVPHCTSAIAAATTFRFLLQLQEALKEQQTRLGNEAAENSRSILILDP